MHTVAIVALDGVVPFDLAIPTEVFGRVRLPDGRAGYEVRVCGVTPEIHAGAFRVKTRYGLGALARADTLLLPGTTDVSSPVPPRLVRALRAASRRGARIASICSGAFILAETGLLDGLRATTHWLAAEELARRHPRIQVDPNVLYVDNGQLLTSAGAAAGMDLCLHLVRRDYGAAVAADAARLSVMPLERDGGQSQFITHAPPAPEGASLEPLLRWMEDHLHRPLTLPALARKAAMSERTLSRRFREQTGTTPLQWLLRARVRRAQHLLETTGQSVEAVAEEVGFGSTTTFREHFQRFVTTSPLAYRRAFRRGPDGLSAGGRSAPPPPGAPRRMRAAS
ncbi:GlxA family transcriptional regulator [Corallococcus sp. EGB]|uniref:GlxA family transcriptional regulator n=1 Tax=Corallococcus sp. EGB TaxID=1521117 RepID=UPI001CBC69EC|nr:helix-turn-helix domain-containing protein [Corallococcus sp. EGB]